MAGKRQTVRVIDQPSDPSVRHIALSKGQIAIVDADDYERLNVVRWQATRAKSTGRFYAVRHPTLIGGTRGTIIMAREIMNAEPGAVVDHIDGTATLDNRKANLRVCTMTGNNRNKRPASHKVFKGVTWHKRDKRWAAGIQIDGKSIHLGNHLTEEAAARAYDRKAIEIFGEFAWLNFPNEVTDDCRRSA